MQTPPPPDLQGAWTLVGPDGRAVNPDIVEMDAAERIEDLVVEVHDRSGVVARGSIAVEELWKARLSVCFRAWAARCLRVCPSVFPRAAPEGVSVCTSCVSVRPPAALVRLRPASRSCASIRCIVSVAVSLSVLMTCGGR
jgi:hypothetical protein